MARPSRRMTAAITLFAHRRRARLRQRHTGVSGGRPASTAITLLTARSIMAVRVSRVALPRCGASTTFSIVKQRLVDDRLALVDVERGAGNQSLVQCPGERFLVDDRSARRVDENRRSASCAPAPAGRSGAASPASAACECEMTSDEISSSSSDMSSLGEDGCMPNAGALAATARPMRPRPMMPSCLPRSSVPSMKSSVHPFQPPRRTSRSPSAIRRAAARIRLQVSSAVASVSTSGVFVTTTPRCPGCRDVDVVVADGDVRHDLQPIRRRRAVRGVDLVGQHATRVRPCRGPAPRSSSGGHRAGRLRRDRRRRRPPGFERMRIGECDG